MTDPTRKDAGLPSESAKTWFCRGCGLWFEKNYFDIANRICRDCSLKVVTSHQSPVTSHPPDEPYIRDVSAANFGVEIRTVEDAVALCGDDKQFCEYCGEPFPLWPVRLWAAHIVHAHHGDLTDQQIGSIAQFCQDGLTPVARQWFGMQILSRLSIRRRARDLGLIRMAGIPRRSN